MASFVKIFKKIVFWNDCSFLSAPHPSSPEGRTPNQDAPRCVMGLLVRDGGPGSRAQPRPCLQTDFGIAGKAQLPHLWLSAVRGWQGPRPPSLAEPAPGLLPSSLKAPPPVLAAPAHGQVALLWPPGASRGHAAPVPTATLSASTIFHSSPLQAVLRPRHGRSCQPVSWQESSWLGILQGTAPIDGKGLLWPSSLWEKKKTPRQVLFVCLLLLCRGKGPAMEPLWSPLCFKPRYCAIKMGDGSQE